MDQTEPAAGETCDQNALITINRDLFELEGDVWKLWFYMFTDL